MLPCRHDAFQAALFGANHGFGERVILLEIASTERNLKIKLPIHSRYEMKVPVLMCPEADKNDWLLLCNIVATDQVLQVMYDDGKRDHLAKLAVDGAGQTSDGGIPMKFYWKEHDEAMIALGRGLHWIRRKLLSFVASFVAL
ncbi:hypothetical protein BKA63DRAFT_588273 [Paraphoma chrysanthemicola]|nr:hypothetical protein BKA63DRAFT_588273 [Paraphoma chrysanthemicola]